MSDTIDPAVISPTPHNADGEITITRSLSPWVVYFYFSAFSECVLMMVAQI